MRTRPRSCPPSAGQNWSDGPKGAELLDTRFHDEDPEDAMAARTLKQRIFAIQTLIMGLQSPLRAAFSEMSDAPVYGRGGFPAEAPMRFQRFHGKV